MRRLDPFVTLLGPALVVALVGIGSTFVSRSNEIHFLNALVAVAIVVAIYVFVGSSGVLSFGQISFVAVGAFAAGVLTVPLESKTGVLPDLFPILRDHTIGTWPRSRSPRRSAASSRSSSAADGVSGSPPGSRPSPCSRSRTTCCASGSRSARRDDALARARDDRPAAGDDRRADRDRRRVALPAQPGRKARATREDPPRRRRSGSACTGSGWAFTLSGALCGFAGGLLVHMLGSITTEQVYLELTFLTLAMLVVGGVTSLWGAVGAHSPSAGSTPCSATRRTGSASASGSTRRRGRGLSFWED